MQPLRHPLFAQFIVYFNENQDYFECHEVLEEYWKLLPGRTKDHPLTMYILLATGLYHYRRGNTKGALRTLQKAYNKMTNPTESFLGFTEEIDSSQLVMDLQQTLNRLKNSEPFESFPIIISSPNLNILVEKIKPTMELLPLGSDDVLHKHMLRDRSDILRAREKAKAKGAVQPQQAEGKPKAAQDHRILR